MYNPYARNAVQRPSTRNSISPSQTGTALDTNIKGTQGSQSTDDSRIEKSSATKVSWIVLNWISPLFFLVFYYWL
ncbi:hypothetical protein HMI54_008948 [Coelomomyces lativittatus]|nr:hypothetical protein HMI55_005170 [Coelomomyces lativittatus]KAJ1502511.1 hypothetical protein HMI54_008948 [Coelomomyces lativittatus]